MMDLSRLPPTPVSVQSPQSSSPVLSPAMRQYQQFKTQYPDYVLFFRMGDFYEMFWEDAEAGREGCWAGADQPKPGRAGGGKMRFRWRGCRFMRWMDISGKMIAAGHKVAICEQAEDPAQAKGVIRREVVRLMTPGTLTDDPLLDGADRQFSGGGGVRVHQGRWLSLGAGVGGAFDRGVRGDERQRGAGA